MKTMNDIQTITVRNAIKRLTELQEELQRVRMPVLAGYVATLRMKTELELQRATNERAF